MNFNRMALHVKKTLAHTLSEHQYGIVDDEKNNSIVKTMVNYLQGLHDVQYLHNFALSVINVSDDQISVSIKITVAEGAEPFLIKSELRTRFKTPACDADFDRAMKGV